MAASALQRMKLTRPNPVKNSMIEHDCSSDLTKIKHPMAHRHIIDIVQAYLATQTQILCVFASLPPSRGTHHESHQIKVADCELLEANFELNRYPKVNRHVYKASLSFIMQRKVLFRSCWGDFPIVGCILVVCKKSGAWKKKAVLDVPKGGAWCPRRGLRGKTYYRFRASKTDKYL